MASVAAAAKAVPTPLARDVAIVEAAVDDPMIVAVAAVAAAAFEAAAAIPATIPEIAIPNNPPVMEVSCFFFYFSLLQNVQYLSCLIYLRRKAKKAYGNKHAKCKNTGI